MIVIYFDLKIRLVQTLGGGAQKSGGRAEPVLPPPMVTPLPENLIKTKNTMKKDSEQLKRDNNRRRNL